MVHKSSVDDVPALVRLLVKSFDDDPIVNWFIRQDERRVHAMARFFEIALRRQTIPHNEVHHADEFRGVALWTPPDKWRLSWWDQLQLAPSIAAIASLRRFLRVLGGLSVLETAHPSKPHFYLAFICAHPEHQGKGIGTELLVPMLERCDREQLPIYLENTKEDNEGWYRRHGFEVTGDIRLANDAPYFTSMWRDPAAK